MQKRNVVTTTVVINTTPEIVWTGITNSFMVLPRPFCFKIGIPLPRKCEIIAYDNEVGTKRKCTSDKGSIEQSITTYEKNKRLSFHMVSNNLNALIIPKYMRDDFIISDNNYSVEVTRTTTYEVSSGAFSSFAAIILNRSIKSVHKYVFDNIKYAAQQGDAPEPATIADPASPSLQPPAR